MCNTRQNWIHSGQHSTPLATVNTLGSTGSCCNIGSRLVKYWNPTDNTKHSLGSTGSLLCNTVPNWATLYPNWATLDPNWATLDPHWAAVDLHWAAVDLHWAALYPHWAALDPHWAALDPHWAALDPHWAALDFKGNTFHTRQHWIHTV
jgi:hypothetical protein